MRASLRRTSTRRTSASNREAREPQAEEEEGDAPLPARHIIDRDLYLVNDWEANQLARSYGGTAFDDAGGENIVSTKGVGVDVCVMVCVTVFVTVSVMVSVVVGVDVFVFVVAVFFCFLLSILRI